jgi:hypothetical protein
MIITEDKKSMNGSIVQPLAVELILCFHLVVSKHGTHIVEVFACAVIPWKGEGGI